MQAWEWDAQGEIPATLLVLMAAAPQGVVPPLGHHLGAQFLLHWVLWVKTLSMLWTRDGGATGDVPLLGGVAA